MSQKKILVIDDDATNREVLQIWFTKGDLTVELASNGEEAFQILSESDPPDLILTDFMMPELNGIELIRRLKVSTKLFNIPVVVMSNNADPESRKRAIELGAFAYLLKTEGARAVAEKVTDMIIAQESNTSTRAPRMATASAVSTVEHSLLALIRFAVQTDGLPVQALHALVSAEKLAEGLCAGSSSRR